MRLRQIRTASVVLVSCLFLLKISGDLKQKKIAEVVKAVRSNV